MGLITGIRGYFAKRQDPYAGGDIDNAQRIGWVLYLLLVLLVAALWPLSPPTDAIGAAGWIPAVAIAGALGAVTLGLRRRRFGSWSALFWVACATVAALEVLQWLGGGHDAPYERLILLPVFFVAAIQPPRRIAGFLGVVALALVVPFLYDGWEAEAAGAAAASFVIWAGLSVGVNIPMSAIRAQRLEHARQEAAAREEARLDALTGLHNRRAFNEVLEKEVAQARRRRTPLSLAMVDITGFKVINDRWGHAEGDRCLCEVASALSECLREPELCFRWGGDEFSMILANTSDRETDAIGARIQEAVSSACKRPDSEPLRVRFAAAELEEGMDAAELTARAGLAIVAGKAVGRAGPE